MITLALTCLRHALTHLFTNTYFIVVTGEWQTCCDGIRETILLDCDVDAMSITWKATNSHMTRKLDWSWGAHSNIFTLAGGSTDKILRWRPCVKHVLFDDDHVVWTPYNTMHKVIDGVDNIMYTRVKRTLNYFVDVDPHDWCSLDVDIVTTVL